MVYDIKKMECTLYSHKNKIDFITLRIDLSFEILRIDLIN